MENKLSCSNGTVWFAAAACGSLKWFEDTCVRVLVYSTGIVRNELICGYICQRRAYFKFISYTHTHTHTHILIPFEDSEPTGLKVDIAEIRLLLAPFPSFAVL